MVLLVKMANLQKHPFFKISRYMIERCMKDEQEEEIQKYKNIFI